MDLAQNDSPGVSLLGFLVDVPVWDPVASDWTWMAPESSTTQSFALLASVSASAWRWGSTAHCDVESIRLETHGLNSWVEFADTE